MSYKHLLNNKGYSLIGLCIVAVIVVIGILYFSGLMFKNGTKSETLTDYSHSQKQTTYGQAMDAGKTVECQSNLNQVRQSIMIYQQSDGTNPPSLEELRLPSEVLSCPMTKQNYNYDPTTGQVKCPSHQEF